MVKSFTLTLAVIALLSVAAFTQARPLSNSNEEKARRQYGDVVVFFADSHYVTADYSGLISLINTLFLGSSTVKTYAFPADAAAVATSVNNAIGSNFNAKTYLVAHGDAAAAVEAYAASTAAHASVAGLAFLGALPTAPLSSFAATSRSIAIVAGDLDGVSPVDTLAYRYLDESAAANSRLYVKLVTGLTNAQFASGVRKYSSDVPATFASGLSNNRMKIAIFLAAWVNYGTTTNPTTFSELYNKAILTSSTNEATQAFAQWNLARTYDTHSLCADFQITTMNLLPTTVPPTIYNQLPDNYDQFVLTKAYVFSENNTISVSTYKWVVQGASFGTVACKGKTQAGVVREGIYAGQDLSTVWGPILSGAEVHQKQYAVATSLASSDAVQRFASSGRSLTFAADVTGFANGPGFLASTGPFLFRSAEDANVFVARSDSYRSPDVCPVGTPPQFCTKDFLSAFYAKFVGAQAFLKFITYQSLQD